MRIEILTLFPEMFSPLSLSILGRAQKAGLVEIRTTDIRAYSKDKHRCCDDAPFGGGKGMVLMAQPVTDAIRAVDPEHRCRRIYLSPRGKTLTQEKVRALARSERLLLLCGHYEGLDQRVIDRSVDEEISIGDYVLTGGELPAMVLVDAVCRHVSGVLAEGSAEEESFSDRLLEYPQYTRPEVFEGDGVPDVLLSGHHANIERWRMQQRIAITAERRPDLLSGSEAARVFLAEEAAREARRKKREAERARRKKQTDSKQG